MTKYLILTPDGMAPTGFKGFGGETDIASNTAYTSPQGFFYWQDDANGSSVKLKSINENEGFEYVSLIYLSGKSLDDYLKVGDWFVLLWEEVFDGNDIEYRNCSIMKATPTGNTFTVSGMNNYDNTTWESTYQPLTLAEPVSSITKVVIEKCATTSAGSFSGLNYFNAFDYTENQTEDLSSVGLVFHVTEISGEITNIITPEKKSIKTSAIHAQTGTTSTTYNFNGYTFGERVSDEVYTNNYRNVFYYGDGVYYLTPNNDLVAPKGKYEIIGKYGNYDVLQHTISGNVIYSEPIIGVSGKTFYDKLYYNGSEQNINLYQLGGYLWVFESTCTVTGEHIAEPVPGVACIENSGKVLYNKVEPIVAGERQKPTKIIFPTGNTTYTWDQLGFTQEMYDQYVDLFFSPDYSVENLNAFIGEEQSQTSMITMGLGYPSTVEYTESNNGTSRIYLSCGGAFAFGDSNSVTIYSTGTIRTSHSSGGIA